MRTITCRARFARLGPVFAFVSLAIAALAATASCDPPRAAPEHTCTGAFAIGAQPLDGSSLPAKTLALTFDDGPGVRTAELSSFLAQHGIHAAFFVNGKNLTQGTGILAQLVADGHVVANHTQTHRSLTGHATASPRPTDAEVVTELEQTDALIAPFAGSRFLFRAPYGDFDALSAAAVAGSPMAKYVGSIHWDIGDRMGPAQAADWDCWKPGDDGLVLTPQQCGDLYLAQIDAVGRGIVLMHDPYFIGDDPQKGGTVDMVERIVPLLEAKGYAFTRVDEVPSVAALLPVIPAPADAPDAGKDAGATGDAGSTTTGDAAAPTPPPASEPGPTPRVVAPLGAGNADGDGARDAGAASPDPCAPARRAR